MMYKKLVAIIATTSISTTCAEKKYEKDNEPQNFTIIATHMEPPYINFCFLLFILCMLYNMRK